MSEGGFVFNNNVSGHGANIAQGQTVNQTITQTFGDSVPTVPEVFQSIEQSLPEIEAAADDDSAAEVTDQILRPLQTLAELPPEEQKQPDKWEQAESLISRLVPYAPQIGKGLAVFGEAALSALASRNPIVAGILAVCNQANA